MRLALGLLPSLLTAGLAGPVLAQQTPVFPPIGIAPSVSVNGTGEVMAEPDTAFVNSGVTTQAQTARAALDSNTEAMAELLSVLKEAGIEERDIQTSNFSVQPNYVYTDQRDENGYTLPPRIQGYIVTNMVAVRVRDLDSLGAVLDRAVTVGANSINGVSFAVAEPDALYNKARREAVGDAREKAEIYAEAAGSTLGRVISINENLGGFPPPQPMMRMEVAAQADASVPIESGELAFNLTVSVSWELLPSASEAE